MGRFKRLSFIIAAFIALFSCTQQEPDIPTPKLSYSDQVDAGFESITLSCTVNGNVSVDRLIVEYSTDQSLAAAQKKSFEKTGDSFTITITGLEIQTTYYYRYTVENKASVFTDEKIRQFKTLDYVVPQLTTVGAKDISGTTATLEGKVDFTCGKTILEQGFRIGKDKNDNLEVKVAELNNFTLKVEGLEFETTYYYQAYARSEIGTGYGEMKELKTCNAVSFKPVVANNITASSASVSGGIEDNGGITIDKQGFRYIEGSSAEFTFIESTGEASLSNLKAATSYKVWYYAKTFEGEFESDKIEFSTTDGSVSFGDYTTTEITAASISLSTSVNGDGGSPITQRGFAYSTKSSPSIDGDHLTVAGTTGQMAGTLSSLTNNTVYYIRAYAKNDVGVSYGTQITITTMSGLAEMGQTTVSEIKAESAKYTSDIVTANGAAITACGFCYGLSENPTTSDSKVVSASTSGTISAIASSLKNNTTYYIRSFATTKYGTSYGAEKSFTTTSGIPEVGQTAIYDIKAQSVSFSSDVSKDNGATITARGFCYGESQNPTTSGNKVAATGTTGEMTASVSSLKNNTKYYVRAYATTKFGTAYGAENTFTTNDGGITFTGLSISGIQPESATASVTISDDGGSSVTERGFCFATTEQPTVSNAKVTLSSSEATYSGVLTSLSRSTNYYVRAYAKNATGTYYSGQVSFTTVTGLATLGTLVSSNVENTSATFSCEVTSDGGATITSRGFCYSTSPTPTFNSSKKTVSGTVGSMQCSITDLSPGTTYYVRAFATTKYGTEYSNEIQVTTKLGLPTMSSVTISNILPTSVSISSGIAVAGDGYILEKGFCYSTTPSPDKDDTIVYVNTNWTISVTGLEQFTKYYVRSFATTQYGTSYSEDTSFTTTYNPVVFSNVTITNIELYSISISCDVTSYGGLDVIDEGFCYSTSSNPTINDNKITNLTGVSSVVLSSLQIGTTYHIRKYVQNRVGVFYSEDISASTYEVSDNAIKGIFSVSSTKRVAFSKGSLIVDSENALSFAPNQSYYIGDENVTPYACYYGSYYNKTRNYPSDMFTTAAIQSKSKAYKSLGNEWSVLTTNEWRYLLNTRDDADKLFANNVTVGGVLGVILLPDNWIRESHNSVASNVSLSASAFTTMENDGAVFIPYAGWMSVGQVYYHTDFSMNSIGYGVRVLAYTGSDDTNTGDWIIFQQDRIEYAGDYTVWTSDGFGIIRLSMVVAQ